MPLTPSLSTLRALLRDRQRIQQEYLATCVANTRQAGRPTHDAPWPARTRRTRALDPDDPEDAAELALLRQAKRKRLRDATQRQRNKRKAARVRDIALINNDTAIAACVHVLLQKGILKGRALIKADAARSKAMRALGEMLTGKWSRRAPVTTQEEPLNTQERRRLRRRMRAEAAEAARLEDHAVATLVRQQFS